MGHRWSVAALFAATNLFLVGCGGVESSTAFIGGDESVSAAPAPVASPGVAPVAAPTPAPAATPVVAAGLVSGTVLSRSVALPAEGAGWGATYYVRVDGGTAAQCTGKTDAAYSGSGTSQACAWKNPMVALPPSGTAARIAGGDKLIIKSGEYRIGYGAVSECDTVGTGCTMQPVPSGPDAARPTRIYGELNASGQCAALPQLWGSKRPGSVINLTSSNNVRVACMDLTDHSECIDEGYPSNYGGYKNVRCEPDSPTDDYASLGIYAKDSKNVQLYNMDIHGFANRGVLAARLTDWTLVNVRIAANPLAGWDGDIYEYGVDNYTNDSNAGTTTWKRVVIEWNGCSETYPGRQPFACFGQYNVGSIGGGYGDGVGTGHTAGNWVIEDSLFLHNVSDGLDLLYHDLGGTVTINRVWAEGNAGNQIKVRGTASITNSVVIGNCGYFGRNMGGTITTGTLGTQPKSLLSAGDHCRAFGDTMAVSTTKAGESIALINNTVVGEGNTITVGGGPAGTTLIMRNNILVGFTYLLEPVRPTGDVYIGAEDNITVDEANTTKFNIYNSQRCATASIVCADPGLTARASIDAVDPNLLSTASALDSGVASYNSYIPIIDIFGKPRPAGSGVDRGAIERQ